MIERSTDTSVRCEMKSTTEIHFDSRRSLEENWLSGRYFHPPPVAINCPLWTGIDAPQQRYNMWKQGRVTQEITQRILWEIERERISQGGWITGRETKTEENEKSERAETVPAPNRKSVLASAAWKVKPFKGFSFINATNTECPDLSDRSALSPLPSHYRFPTESKWENSSLCFCSFWARKLWLLDACEEDTEGGFTEVAACLWSLTEHSEKAGKWCKYTRGTIKCLHSWSHTKALLNTHW